MSVAPAYFDSGQVTAWSTEERCRLIVDDWRRQGSTAAFRIYPAREYPPTAHAPEWAYVIEAKT